MGGKLGRKFAAVIVALSAAATFAVVAQPSGADTSSVYKFNYNVDATTTVKKLNQTIVITGGTFSGGIDFGSGTSTAPLVGKITLPDSTFTFKAADLIPLMTATARIVPTKAVRGFLDLSTFNITATATFNIRIVDAHITGTTTNLVGTTCMTSKPIAVTMSGPASLGAPSVFTGLYTIPPLQNCGLATTALNLVLPGPGNTFTASATPK
jgi:hypothetical protein